MMERNITLDYFKILLSILVIILHCPFVTIYPPVYVNFWTQIEYILGWQVSYGISKISVPLFFVINGYFLDINNRRKTVKYITRLVILYVVWTILYLPWFYPQFQTDLRSLLITIFTGFFHLWYFIALIGAIILLYGLNKIKVNKNFLFILSIVLFAIGYYIQQKDPYDNFEMLKYRNFLFWGFPFVTIGYLLKSISYDKVEKFIPSTILIGFVLLSIEAYIYMEQQETNNLYITTLLLCPAIFSYIVKNGKRGVYHKPNTIADMPIAIFIIHPMVILSSNEFGINEYLGSSVLFFLFIVAITIPISYLIVRLNRIVKIFL